MGFLLFGLAFIFSQKVQDTILKRQASNQIRLTFFKTALKAVSERPLFGFGFKNFEPHTKLIKKRYNMKYQNIPGHAHNNYLEHLASTGIIGFILMLCFCFRWIWETYRYQPLLFPFVMSFLVSGMTQYTFGDGENVFFILGIFSLF